MSCTVLRSWGSQEVALDSGPTVLCLWDNWLVLRTSRGALRAHLFFFSLFVE